MNVAKTEQDAVTTTAGSHCLIVCGSHRNAYSGRVFLLHQLHTIICFSAETQRYSPEGDEGVRGLCSPGAGRVHRPTWELVLLGWRPKGKPSGSPKDRVTRHGERCGRFWCSVEVLDLFKWGGQAAATGYQIYKPAETQ